MLVKANIAFGPQTDGTAPTFNFNAFYLDNEYISADPKITNFSRNLIRSGQKVHFLLIMNTLTSRFK